MTSFSSASKATLKIVFSRVSDFRILTMSFLSRTRGALGPFAVEDGGDPPVFRIRREAFFPNMSRFSLLMTRLMMASSLHKQ